MAKANNTDKASGVGRTREPSASKTKRQKPLASACAPNSEAWVQRIGIAYFKKHGLFCWRNNSAGIFDAKIGKHRALGFGKLNGTPDLIGIGKTGRFIGIEFKSATGKLSNDQAEFFKLAITNNAICYVCKSAEDMLSIVMALKELGEI